MYVSLSSARPEEVTESEGTGSDFISCAFVFRSDYSRGHKRKIRYVQDTYACTYVWSR